MARSDYNLVNGRGSSILPSDARGHRNKSQGITWGMLLRNKRTWILIAVLFMFFYSANKFINGLDNEDEDLAIVGEVDVEIQDKTNSESTHQRSSFKTSSARDPVDVKKDEKQRQLQKERAAAEREKTSQLAKTDLGDPTKSKKVIIAPPTIPNAEFVEVDKKYIFWIEDTDVLPELKNGFKGKAADGSKRANACIMILAQDKDLDELRRTLRNFEDRFNRRFKYPYVFINDKAFSKGFKSYIRSIVSAPVEFGIIPKTMWGYPSWIDLDKAADTREKMKNIIYGSSESYRHMCRFFSGFATRHPLIAKYDFYWRVEPGVEFFCDITQDPFMEMQEKNQKYGFTITLHEYMDTIPTLWNHTIAYAHEKNLASNLLKFFVNDDGIYNGCHFWSNFEIAATSFMNSPEYLGYHAYLDKAGGYFYERWGDAPVHSLAVAILLQKHEVAKFDYIGYRHDLFYHCRSSDDLMHKCICPKADTKFVNVDKTDFSCNVAWEKYKPEMTRVRDLFTVQPGN